MPLFLVVKGKIKAFLINTQRLKTLASMPEKTGRIALFLKDNGFRKKE
jgi:hypothetical protein